MSSSSASSRQLGTTKPVVSSIAGIISTTLTVPKGMTMLIGSALPLRYPTSV